MEYEGYEGVEVSMAFNPMDPFGKLDAMLVQQQFMSHDGVVGIILQPYRIELFVDGRTTGYRLYVKAFHGRNMPNEIFVYQRKSTKDDFSNVASMPDLEEYAAGPIILDAQRPFYRLDYVDLVFRNISLLVDALYGLYSDTQELVWSIKANTYLTEIGELVVGNPYEPSSSSSSSA